MRVLVSGSGGFIGAALVPRLVAGGHDVVALVRPGGRRPPQGDAALPRDGDTAGAAPAGQVEIVEVDLDDVAGLEARVRAARPEAVVHLAWFARPGRFWSAPENLDDVGCTLRLARVTAAAGCRRWIGAGTCAEYDWDLEGPLHETRTPCRPGTLYGTAKWAAFCVLQRFFRPSGISFAWLRYNFIYGPGEAAGRLVPAVIEALVAGRDAECSEGRQRRDFIHVQDLAAATAAVLESGVKGPVNIGSGETRSVREVVEILAQAIGGPGRPRFGARPSGDEPQEIRPDLTRLFEEVGWKPRFDLATGLQQTLVGYRR